MSLPAYAELHCLSNFSFQRGASSARELFERARALGYTALAITDECSLAGIVRAHEAAKATGLKLIVGSELHLTDGLHLLLLARTLAGYQALCALITQARRAADKGRYHAPPELLDSLGDSGLFALWLPSRPVLLRYASADADDAALTGLLQHQGQRLRALFGTALHLACALHRLADDDALIAATTALAADLRLAVVAVGSVVMHQRSRRALADVLLATGARCTVATLGWRALRNGEAHLRKRDELAALYPSAWLAASVAIADQIEFDLTQLRYSYPAELVPPGLRASDHLRALTQAGLARRFSAGTPVAVKAQVEHELSLISELRYEPYFLTVYDIVAYARSRGILCQGRGSAANSAVCYALGITEVDPARMHMLFERFISRERNEPPDIDVDFEHDRREEVIQYIYRKYGRERAALAATVICYRPRSAVRDVARALGFSLDQIDALTATLTWWDDLTSFSARIAERGFDPQAPVIRQLRELVAQLVGMPRHLSQHVGGFVIADAPLSTLVPVENAAMAERTVIQWDKDDLDTMGLLKVDCLALGMLSAIQRCLSSVSMLRGTALTVADVPAEDPATYAMIQAADTVGVFQIESRAQMAMLPRLRPRSYYDLVIEVAIVRPGPIQGKMVHPYLRRRQGLEPVDYPSPALRAVFERTLGVPIFQEQVMQLAIVAAGFSPGEADQLRRSMAAWKRRGGLDYFQQRIVSGMCERGYSAEFALQVFEQIRGFGSYGFPESHAASFALLVYVSAWLKCHEPVAFAQALLNSQPMGFYSPSQIVQDLRRHGHRVWPVDVRYSAAEATLEVHPGSTLTATRTMPVAADGQRPQPALRLGLAQIRGLSSNGVQRLLAARAQAPFVDLADLSTRARLDRADLNALARAGALSGLSGHRHRAAWNVAGLAPLPGLFAGQTVPEPAVQLTPPSAIATLELDYASTGLSLGPHPMQLLRPRLAGQRLVNARMARDVAHGSRVRMAGLVTLRQRPESAGGVMFLTLEDETGQTNVVVFKQVAARQRSALLGSRLLMVDGVLESADGVQHLIAERLSNLNSLLGGLDARSRDFH